MTTRMRKNWSFDSITLADLRLALSRFLLTLKAPITTAADDIHKYFFIVFLEKKRLDVSSESSEKTSLIFFER